MNSNQSNEIGLHQILTIAKSVLILCALFLTIQVEAKIHRDHKAITAFKLEHPCPATGKSKGSCKGYVIDHVKPLACGGADHPSNMQWQSVADAKLKDKWERKECKKKM